MICRREQSRRSQAKWRASNPEAARTRSRESSAKWRAENPEAKRAADRRYRERNREQMLAKGKAWKAANPEQHRAHSRKSTAIQRALNCPKRPEAKPAWADDEALRFFYECRPAGCHVDHIIPLRGEAVCGLHVAENLQWLPASENLSKRSTFEPYAVSF